MAFTGLRATRGELQWAVQVDVLIAVVGGHSCRGTPARSWPISANTPAARAAVAEALGGNARKGPGRDGEAELGFQVRGVGGIGRLRPRVSRSARAPGHIDADLRRNGTAPPNTCESMTGTSFSSSCAVWLRIVNASSGMRIVQNSLLAAMPGEVVG